MTQRSILKPQVLLQMGRRHSSMSVDGLPSPKPRPIPRLAPAQPSSPGCYFKQPAASSKCGGPFPEWERDTWGETNANSGATEAECMARKAGHDAYCEVSTEWFFGGATTPSPSSRPSPSQGGGQTTWQPSGQTV